ncbi:MAG: hypothetical protein IKP24_02410 [Alphaproteobacteria bacterium]|nr:hypothetical protein [Alphaproteobacteria bacterium]
MQKVPEKFQNDDGTTNVDALLKSYNELEKKIGGMISVPHNDDDKVTREKFNRAIGVPENADDYPKNDLFDDESIKQKFHDMGLTSHQVEQIYSVAEEFLSPVITELFSVKNETDEISKLEKFFGSRDKMNDALSAINTFGEKFLPHDAFESLCSSASGIQGVYAMMQSMEPHIETNIDVQENLTDADLRRMMRDPKYWRDADPEYVRKIENGFKKLYSNEKN